jgi:hypothetical protein
MMDLGRGARSEADVGGEAGKLKFAVKKGIRFRSPIVGAAQAEASTEDEEMKLRWSTAGRKPAQEGRFRAQ